jgi:hypothetical protein
MRKVGGAVVLVLAALLLACVQEMRPAHRISGFTEQNLSAARGAAAELLDNPGFEGGIWYSQVYWKPSGGPYWPGVTPGDPIRGNVMAPEGWTAWWREGFDCAFCGGGPCTFQTGQPEDTPTTYPERVRSGAKAHKAFTFYRCHDTGLWQQVWLVQPGRYVFSVYAHAWYTGCSSKPHASLLAGDCVTQLSARDELVAGVDLAGGVDPAAPTVAWGISAEQYDAYGDQPLVVVFEVASPLTATLFTRSVADTPLKHADTYWDDASLWRVAEETYLPLVLSQHKGD